MREQSPARVREAHVVSQSVSQPVSQSVSRTACAVPSGKPHRSCARIGGGGDHHAAMCMAKASGTAHVAAADDSHIQHIRTYVHTSIHPYIHTHIRAGDAACGQQLPAARHCKQLVLVGIRRHPTLAHCLVSGRREQGEVIDYESRVWTDDRVRQETRPYPGRCQPRSSDLRGFLFLINLRWRPR